MCGSNLVRSCCCFLQGLCRPNTCRNLLTDCVKRGLLKVVGKRGYAKVYQSPAAAAADSEEEDEDGIALVAFNREAAVQWCVDQKDSFTSKDVMAKYEVGQSFSCFHFFLLCVKRQSPWW